MKHTGRHTGAFLLLFLAEGDNYGGQLLQKCEEELPSIQSIVPFYIAR